MTPSTPAESRHQLALEMLITSVSALHEAIGQNKAFLSYDAQIDSRRNLDFRLMHDNGAGRTARQTVAN
jgi:hypothetical protein